MNHRKSNAPYSNAHYDSELNLAVHGNDNHEQSNDVPMVQNVSVIGALFNENMDLWDKDIATVAHVLRILKETDVVLSRNIKFYFYNLLPPLKNDFLEAAVVEETAPASEVVIVAGVFGAKVTGHDFRSLPLSLQTPLKDFSSEELVGVSARGFNSDRITTVSNIQSMPQAWEIASNNVGAKFVITDGVTGIDYINTDDFLHDGFYNPIVSTSENYVTTANGSYGILVRNEDLPEIKTAVTPASDLGKRILSL